MNIEYFYWVLMIFKLFLATWLFKRSFYYSSVFIFSHAVLDIACLLYSNYWLGTLSFILKPYILAGCLAEVYQDKLLRKINIGLLCANLIAFVTLPYLFGVYINLPILTAFFGVYALSIFFILGEKILDFKKDTYPLMSALMLIIPETLIFFQSKYVYLLINIINIVYYLSILGFLCFCSKYIEIVCLRSNQRRIRGLKEDRADAEHSDCSANYRSDSNE